MEAHLLRFQHNLRYLVYDFETCGLNLTDVNNRVWQVGYLVCEGDKILEEHSHYLRWEDLNIPEETAKLTRFDRGVYETNWVDPKEILEQFNVYFYDPAYMLLGHNILGFDVYMHRLWSKSVGVKAYDYSYIDRSIDTNALARAWKLGWKPSKDQDLLSFQYSSLARSDARVKTNLSLLGKELEIDFDPNTLHSAANDVKLNFAVWNKLKYKIDI